MDENEDMNLRNTPQIDIVTLSKTLDSNDLIGLTRNFVEDFRNGLDYMNSKHLPWIDELSTQKWDGIICLGMGGSAAGGDFLSALTKLHGNLPVHIQRDYVMPAWWKKSWLVLTTSHSGNTEEALSATEIALNSGATVVIISTGGMLSGLCEIYSKCHLIPSVGGQPPRTAFGHIFSRQLGLLRRLKVLPAPEWKHDLEMIERLQKASEGFDFIKDPDGDLIELATYMTSRPIALIGPTELSPALIRFKNQLNENSARFARIGIIPEMNHNELVAWGGIGKDRDYDTENQVVLFLTWQGMHKRVEHRIDWMVAHTTTEFAWKLHGEGSTLLESLLHLCIVMDWLSIGLALIHGKDPERISPILALKDFLEAKKD